ncbi:MAG: hypothetical protein ACI8TX_001360, partial [Hyphomicrobiaceae bacterium]
VETQDRNTSRRPVRVASGEQKPRQRFSRTRVRSFMLGENAAGETLGEVEAVKRTPELALMLAVLEDAIACYHGSLKAPRENPTVLRRQAQLWFGLNDWDSPFSFNNICEALHLDPNATRERILAEAEVTPVVATRPIAAAPACYHESERTAA